MPRELKVDVGGRSYTVEFLGAYGRHVQVRVNGQPFQVEVSGAALPGSLRTHRYSSASHMQAGQVEAELARAHPSSGAAASSDPGQITSPMNGRIVRIAVQEGDRIQSGDEVCVLEAMKMEQSIRASTSGTVKAVHVQPGQGVGAGHLLIELGARESFPSQGS